MKETCASATLSAAVSGTNTSSACFRMNGSDQYERFSLQKVRDFSVILCIFWFFRRPDDDRCDILKSRTKFPLKPFLGLIRAYDDTSRSFRLAHSTGQLYQRFDVHSPTTFPTACL